MSAACQKLASLILPLHLQEAVIGWANKSIRRCRHPLFAVVSGFGGGGWEAVGGFSMG